MFIISAELIMLILIVLLSIFISMAIIIVSVCVIYRKSSKLLDDTILNELKY